MTTAQLTLGNQVVIKRDDIEIARMDIVRLNEIDEDTAAEVMARPCEPVTVSNRARRVQTPRYARVWGYHND